MHAGPKVSKTRECKGRGKVREYQVSEQKQRVSPQCEAKENPKREVQIIHGCILWPCLNRFAANKEVCKMDQSWYIARVYVGHGFVPMKTFVGQ
jgi:hypothetical protein